MRILVYLIVMLSVLHGDIDHRLESFSSISKKNIFSSIVNVSDKQLDVQIIDTASEVKNEEEVKHVSEEPKLSVLLYGVLIEKSKTFVFISTETKELKILTLNDRINGLLISSVNTEAVDLKLDESVFTLKVGAGLISTGDGSWKLSDKASPALTTIKENDDKVDSFSAETNESTIPKFSSKQKALLEKLKARRSKEVK